MSQYYRTGFAYLLTLEQVLIVAILCMSVNTNSEWVNYINSEIRTFLGLGRKGDTLF